MKPLLYGYMRVDDHAEDDIDQAERALMSYADAEGFCYEKVARLTPEFQSGKHRD